MTLTNTAGLPDEIRAGLARARVSQEAACLAADITKRTYYRRMDEPGDWRLDELERLLATAGLGLQLSITALVAPERP